jgi:hypothetical protein
MQWDFYIRLFTVQSGMDESYGNGEGWLHYFDDSQNYYSTYGNTTINFLKSGQQAGKFSWKDNRTLAQIEKMTGYTVKPRGVCSQFKHGGFVVYEENGHGLVAAITDLGITDWNSAKTACDELTLNGYSDWHLPSKEEINAVYVNLYLKGVIFFERYHTFYWSSTEYDNYYPFYKRFTMDNEDNEGRFDEISKSEKFRVRAVRTF